MLVRTWRRRSLSPAGEVTRCPHGNSAEGPQSTRQPPWDAAAPLLGTYPKELRGGPKGALRPPVLTPFTTASQLAARVTGLPHGLQACSSGSLAALLPAFQLGREFYVHLNTPCACVRRGCQQSPAPPAGRREWCGAAFASCLWCGCTAQAGRLPQQPLAPGHSISSCCHCSHLCTGVPRGSFSAGAHRVRMGTSEMSGRLRCSAQMLCSHWKLATVGRVPNSVMAGAPQNRNM